LGFELCEKPAILVQAGKVLREGIDVSDRMNESVVHVPAKIGTGFGYERNAAAAHGFGTDESETFLDTGENKDVALAHEIRDIVPMAENANTGVRELRSELLPIGGEKLSSNEEGAVAMGGRAQPGIESEVQAFSYGADTDEENSETATGIGRGIIFRIVDAGVVSIDVASQLCGREPAVEEGSHGELGRAEKTVSEPILVFFFAEDIGLVGMLMVGRQAHADAIAFLLHNLIGKTGMGVRPFQHGGDA
jgi:hypothetical protein